MFRVAPHVRLAACVGLVGGFLCGVREAVLTLSANAAIQPGQYFSVYLAAPIISWMVLGALLLAPLGVAIGVARGRSEPRSGLGLYAGVFGFFAVGSVVFPWIGELTTRLRDVGLRIGPFAHVALWGLGVFIATSSAGLAAAAGASYASRAQRLLRHATPAVLLVGLALLWPIAQFVATDWKWQPPRFAAARADTSGRPNVLPISIDTLRADHLGAYGDARGLTPHLDQLAAQGVTFDHAITSAPWTLPAVASLLTALYPHRHGAGLITNRRDPLGRSALPDRTWTLAAALRESGYRTHAIVTNPYLALQYGLGQGFETYENVTIESEAFLAFSDTTAVRLLRWLRPDLIIGDRGETVSRRAAHWLANGREGVPFFLWLHYVDPHPPYSRRGATRHKSFRGDVSFGDVDGRGLDLTLTSPDVARLRSGEIRLNHDEKEAVRNLYRAEVAAVDAAIGPILEAVDQWDLRERTLVVVIADHGEELWDHGGVEHGHTVYDELVRIPLLMRWPGHLTSRVARKAACPNH